MGLQADRAVSFHRLRLRARGRLLALALAATAALVSAALAAEPAAADTPRAGPAAVAANGIVVVRRGDRGRAVVRIQRRLGISADGVFGRQTERAVKRFQRRRGLVADGVVGPITRRALGLRAFGRGSVYRPRGRRVSLPAILRRIAICESGGNPRAISPGGTYRGKYQFAVDTWRGLGGSGDPARAPEWLQDRMALKLYRLRGTAPWPACSR